jgi:adenylate cyclase class 2
MKTEFETKVLNINVATVIKKLKEIGAKETLEVLSRRYLYYPNKDDGTFIRLREMGKKTTVTYKERSNSTEIGQTQEIEVSTTDFKKTAEILSKINFNKTLYQENKRQTFILEDIQFSIDSWPHINPFLEIEADSKENVQKGLALIGLIGEDVGDKGLRDIYNDEGLDLYSFKILKFGDKT